MKRYDSGQGLVEYALILVLVAVVVIAILLLLGPIIETKFNEIICGLGEDAPCVYANDDHVTTFEDTPQSFNVTSNDEAVSSTLVYSSVEIVPGSGPDHGTLVNNGNGAFIYTPSIGFTGNDFFSYTIRNDVSNSDEALVTINVGAYASAVDDFGTVSKNGTMTIKVTENDFIAPERDLATPTIISGPDWGEATPSSDRLEFSYTPELDYVGVDHFEYELCNTLGYCDTAIVTIDVLPDSVSVAAAAAENVAPGITETSAATEPGSAEFMLERMEYLWEASYEQEEALNEVMLLMQEAMLETLEAPAEFAQENGEVALYEQISAIIELAQNGDYDAAAEVLLALAGGTIEIPAEVRLKSIAKYLPPAVDACQVLGDRQVSFLTFAEAREAMVLFGAVDRAADMDEIWQIVEQRNTLIMELHPALVGSAEIGIEILLDSGQNKYIHLAERLGDELIACGGG